METQRSFFAFAGRPDLVAGFIVLATTLVRYWFIATGQLDLVQDEAQYWDWSRDLQLSYYSKGPLIAYINWLGTAFFGNTELGVRIGAVMGSLLVQCVIYLGLSKLAGRSWLGVWTLVIANTAPLFMAAGVMMTTDNPLIVCWSGALFCVYWLQRPDLPGASSRWPASLLAACVAFGILAKYMMLAILPVVFMFWLGLAWDRRLDRAGVKRSAAALLAGVVLGLLPILLWNAMNDFVGFRHVGALAGMADQEPQALLKPLQFLEYIGVQAGLITPWWLWFMLLGGCLALRLLWKGRKEQQAGEPETGGQPADRTLLWLLVAGFWPMWLYFLLWSFKADKLYPNWPAVCYAAGFCLAGLGFMRWREKASPGWKKAWPLVGLAIFLLLHLQNWLPVPDAVNPALRLKGWSDLGRKLEEVRQTEFSDPDKVFFFAKSYAITAALSFYGPEQKRAYCADFGRRMSQYDLWPDPGSKKGWDAVFVRKRFRNSIPEQLDGMCGKVENFHYQTTHRGQPARKFTITLCRDFTGVWPRSGKDEY